MYKKSQFNHETNIPGTDNRVVFNFRTKKMAELNPVQQMIFDQAPFEDISSPFLTRMYTNGFLADYDEYADLYEAVKITKDSSHKMRVTICPTMLCNFNCSYCIETGQIENKNMSEEVQDAVVRFIEKRVEAFGVDDLFVFWYGGEPLMNPSVIENISEKLIALADSKGITYGAQIYTNGYLLTEKNIRMLERCRVEDARISVDGTRENHDKMRFLKNGQGSYDVIMSNLRNTRTSICYRIRCNLTKYNLDNYENLVKELQDIADYSGNKIFVEPERVRVEKNVDPKLKEIEIPDPVYYEWYNKLRSSGVSGQKDPIRQIYERKAAACGACLKNTFVIDVGGNLHKCNFFMGYPEHVVGNVLSYEDESSLLSNEEYEYFSNYVLSDMENCKKCKILPICLGRCPYTYHYCPGRYDCHRLISDLDGIVLKAYERSKEQKK